MHVEELRAHCLKKPMVTEGLPFGEHTLVFKVGGKMFMLMGLDEQPPRLNLKCEPSLAIQLRETYSCVLPGYHMYKTHWNTVVCDGSVPKALVFSWIDSSYELVRAGLPKKAK